MKQHSPAATTQTTLSTQLSQSAAHEQPKCPTSTNGTPTGTSTGTPPHTVSANTDPTLFSRHHHLGPTSAPQTHTNCLPYTLSGPFFPGQTNSLPVHSCTWNFSALFLSKLSSSNARDSRRGQATGSGSESGSGSEGLARRCGRPNAVQRPAGEHGGAA